MALSIRRSLFIQSLSENVPSQFPLWFITWYLYKKSCIPLWCIPYCLFPGCIVTWAWSLWLNDFWLAPPEQRYWQNLSNNVPSQFPLWFITWYKRRRYKKQSPGLVLGLDKRRLNVNRGTRSFGGGDDEISEMQWVRKGCKTKQTYM